MTDERTQRGGFFGFLSTIPGILTAFAAVVTALGGIYAVSQQGGLPSDQQPVIVNINPASLPDETLNGDQQIQVNALPDASVGDQWQQVIDGCAQGYMDLCMTLLDGLSQECYQEIWESCDVLYRISPLGSDYETYGATCGGRVTWDYANNCA